MTDPTTDAAREAFTEAEIVANHGNPTWEAIWGVIKKWDISRDGSPLYANANGDDVQRIFLAVAAVSRARDAAWREEIAVVSGMHDSRMAPAYNTAAEARAWARGAASALAALRARMDGAK